MIRFKGYTKHSLTRLLVDGTLYVYGLCSLDVVPVNNWGLCMTGFCPVARELVPSHTYATLFGDLFFFSLLGQAQFYIVVGIFEMRDATTTPKYTLSHKT